MVIRRPIIIHFTAKTTDNRIIHLSESEEYRIFIESENKLKIRLIDAAMLFRKDLQKEKPCKIIYKSYDYKACVINVKNIERRIDALTFISMLTVIEEHQNKAYSMVDQVWLIMKSIFEAQTFLISQHGFIVNG